MVAAEVFPAPEPALAWAALEAAHRRMPLRRLAHGSMALLVEAAASADVLVLGERGLRTWTAPAGLACAPALAAVARRPVVAVPDVAPLARPPLVVVGVSDQASSAGAVTHARRWAEQRGCALLLLHACVDDEGRPSPPLVGDRPADLAGALAGLPGRSGLDERARPPTSSAAHLSRGPAARMPVHTELATTDAVTALVTASRRADLLVLGQRADSVVGGPVVHGVLERPGCPVVIVRAG